MAHGGERNPSRQVCPLTLDELHVALVQFASDEIDLLIIDGGDGTVRDVLTAGSRVWSGKPPRLLVMPSGKTNALARDLGIPSGSRADRGVAIASSGRLTTRTPIEVRTVSRGSLVARGFIFGAGAFVDATDLAQKTHRAGAFANLAVGLTLAWSVGRTICSRDKSAWSTGTSIGIAYGDNAVGLHGAVPEGDGARYLMLASTLHRLPLGLRPFGRPRSGMKTLLIDAPPRSVATSALRLLCGSEASILSDRGYHRVDTDVLKLDLPYGFIMDGERYPGGEYQLTRGRALEFLTT